MSTNRDPLSPELVRRLTAEVGPFMSCDDCFRLADRFVEGLLADEDEPAGPLTTAMRYHLAGCPACSEETASLLLLAAEDHGIDASAALARLG